MWLLIGLASVYFHRVLLLGETFYFRDLYLYFLPEKQLLAKLIRVGEWPLWNPYLHGGLPYLADVSNAALYPSNVLYLILPPVLALNLDLVLHVVLALVAAYALSRTLNLDPPSSVVVAVVYGFCGYCLSLVNLYGKLLAMPYVPLLLLFWHRFFLSRRSGWLISAVAAGVLQVLVGAPETVAVTLLFALAWTFLFPYSSRPLQWRAGRYLVLVASVLGLSAVQLLPLLEMTWQSPRGRGLPYDVFAYWSLNPMRLPELILPGFLGPTDTLKESDFWGQQLVDGAYPFILSIYYGLLGLSLALAGGVSREKTHPVPRAVRTVLVAAVGMAILLSFGRFLPGFRLVHAYLPLASLFRYPVKFLLLGALPLAILAGCGSQLYFSQEGERRHQPRVTLLVWICALALATTAMAVTLSPAFADRLALVFFQRTGAEIRRGLSLGLIHACLIWWLAALVYQYRQAVPRAWQPWLLAAVLALDLLSAGRSVNPSAPSRILSEVPPIVDSVHGAIGAGRLYRAPNPEGILLQTPSEDPVWRYRWQLEVLNLYLAPYYGIPLIFNEDYNGMVSSRLISMKQGLESLPWERRLPLLSSGSVSLILTHEVLPLPNLEHVATIANASNVPFYLYRNRSVADRVRFVTAWHAAPSEAEALRALTHPDFDPRAHVVIEGAGVSSQPGGCRQAWKIDDLDASLLRWRLNIVTHCPGYLVFSEPFYPGWTFYVDGQRRLGVRSNSAFSGIYLEPGRHRVERRYFPLTLYLGCLLSACCLFLLLAGTRRGWFA